MICKYGFTIKLIIVNNLFSTTKVYIRLMWIPDGVYYPDLDFLYEKLTDF